MRKNISLIYNCVKTNSSLSTKTLFLLNLTVITLKLSDEFKVVNLFSLSAGAWNCSSYIDGAFLASKSALIQMVNMLPKKSRDMENKSTGVWENVTGYFCRHNTKNYKLISLNYTLMQHDGNDDSKLHPKLRLKIPITALNFYDNFYGNQIIPISQSILGYTQNGIKKKSSGDTLSGNKITNDEPKIQETPKPTQIVINTPIATEKPNLKKEITPEKMQKPKTINKTHSELFMGKAMKKRLRFGKK